MAEEAYPTDVNRMSVRLGRKDDPDAPKGELAYKNWSDAETASRARKRTIKIIGTILLCCIPVVFIPLVHFSLFVIVPLTLFASIPLYLKFAAEKSTFYFVEADCPSCKKPGKLRPYTSSRLEETMTVQCPDCGQTTAVSKLNQ